MVLIDGDAKIETRTQSAKSLEQPIASNQTQIPQDLEDPIVHSSRGRHASKELKEVK